MRLIINILTVSAYIALIYCSIDIIRTNRKVKGVINKLDEEIESIKYGEDTQQGRMVDADEIILDLRNRYTETTPNSAYDIGYRDAINYLESLIDMFGNERK